MRKKTFSCGTAGSSAASKFAVYDCWGDWIRTRWLHPSLGYAGWTCAEQNGHWSATAVRGQENGSGLLKAVKHYLVWHFHVELG